MFISSKLVSIPERRVVAETVLEHYAANVEWPICKSNNYKTQSRSGPVSALGPVLNTEVRPDVWSRSSPKYILYLQLILNKNQLNEEPQRVLQTWTTTTTSGKMILIVHHQHNRSNYAMYCTVHLFLSIPRLLITHICALRSVVKQLISSHFVWLKKYMCSAYT